MPRLRFLPVFTLTLLLPLATANEKIDLDVTRIALFSSGVGYFECDQSVLNNATAELKFRTDQINDIIKSMVVQDYTGGQIGVISYASRDPLEKTLRSFGVDLTGNPTLGDLLSQLRGEPVSISGAVSLTGTIVNVEKQPIINPDNETLQQREFLTILTSDGLRRLPLDQLENIQLTNPKVASELRKALQTLARAHDADKKSVQLRFEGTGQRHIRVAYLLEAPIWKTSYRLVLTDEQEPFLQGWATVENATEEDWNNVQLSLVSGRPISFRMDLYTPLYVPRPLETLDIYSSLRPPQYDAGFEPAWADADVPARLKNSQTRGRALRAGGQSMSPPPKPMKAYAEEMAERESLDLSAGIQSVADAQQAGELFEYRIATPVSIPRQHSAMLPIINDNIDAHKVSIFNPATHAKHPLNGLELKNTTGLHLMQGPVTVFDDDIYAGDAKLPDINPAEKRFIAYALDLATEVMIEQQPRHDTLLSLRIAKGTLWQRTKHIDRRVYHIKNKADKLRTVILEQPYRDDWKLTQPDKPYERASNLLRFKLNVPADQTEHYPVELERIADQSIMLAHTGLDQIRYYLRARVISPALKQALERVIELRTELDRLERQTNTLEQKRREAIDEQDRIRNNLKTLDRNTDAYRRQLQRFDEIDQQIIDFRADLDAARQAVEQKHQQLENYLLNLNVE